MSYYRVCPRCGAHLDPGEVCDCREQEKTVRGAANTTDGRVEKVVKDQISTSHNTGKSGGLQDEYSARY